MIIGFLAAVAVLQSPACHAPSGTNQLWASPTTRMAIVGEVHGTTETPSAFFQMICEASAKGPVVVGLEYEDAAQTALDAWMLSDGGEVAHAALLESAAFTRRFEDGRSSAAMLELLSNLRDLKVDGRPISVIAFRPTSHRAEGFSQGYDELEMGRSLSRMIQDHPDAFSMVLVGRFHASKTMIGSLLPAVAHLPRDDIVSVQLNLQGGEAWTCGGDGPKPECHGRPTGGDDDGERGLILEASPDGRFDGRLSLGPLSASVPALSSQSR